MSVKVCNVIKVYVYVVLFYSNFNPPYVLNNRVTLVRISKLINQDHTPKFELCVCTELEEF